MDKLIKGYDKFEKYLIEKCKDTNYLKKNLDDIIIDNMLEAEHEVTGIDLEIYTNKEKILINYNISYGETSKDLIEHYKILSITNL